jgi:two-component system, OmpR family, response regulator
MQLLIVEDEVRMADLLRKGLAFARSYDFDVIILDVMMPKLSGYELARRLRAENVRTPILMLTAAIPCLTLSVAWTWAPTIT